jgi:hypothetical protein
MDGHTKLQNYEAVIARRDDSIPTWVEFGAWRGVAWCVCVALSATLGQGHVTDRSKQWGSGWDICKWLKGGLESGRDSGWMLVGLAGWLAIGGWRCCGFIFVACLLRAPRFMDWVYVCLSVCAWLLRWGALRLLNRLGEARGRGGRRVRMGVLLLGITNYLPYVVCV